MLMMLVEGKQHVHNYTRLMFIVHFKNPNVSYTYSFSST